jgi:probable HAF family extracellular repeat protein
MSSRILSTTSIPSKITSGGILTLRIAAWIGLILASAAFAAAQTYTITEIGLLKGDNENSGFWINNLGEVVGCSDKKTAEDYPCTGLVPGQHAFSWTASGGTKDLGTLSGATVSGAIGVNDSGTVVGYSNVKGQPATNFVAVQWSSTGAITDLGTLAGGSSSSAFEINSAGEIAGDSFLSSGVVDATSWTSNKIKNLGGLSKAIFTAGLDINDSGEIVGESVLSYGPPFSSRAFLWNGTTMKNLGVLPGGITSIANAINTSGVIVGQSDGTSTGGSWHAVMWNASDKIQDLGVLPEGTYSIAFDVNDSGVVVGYGNGFGNETHAMVWTSAAGMQDLNGLIPSDSGWVLINANAINNVGQITGYGTKGGYNRAFVLTPVN